MIISVLTHGEAGKLYAHDTAYEIKTIVESFAADRCPTLAGKPKLLFIQVCSE